MTLMLSRIHSGAPDLAPLARDVCPEYPRIGPLRKGESLFSALTVSMSYFSTPRFCLQWHGFAALANV
ncbi:hypothetical protein J6590_024351 [Homalodisca vitripennis]|nr:hypothetical protein J6590_024351 [Homalodisca vitripennis]